MVVPARIDYNSSAYTASGRDPASLGTRAPRSLTLPAGQRVPASLRHSPVGHPVLLILAGEVRNARAFRLYKDHPSIKSGLYLWT
jgi:hypothetical protein